jgi:metallo-beta-lactamase class B
MPRLACLAIAACLLPTPAPARAPDPVSREASADQIHCDSCEGWNQPQAPFRIHGNTWYVGTRELTAILVTGPQGHVLLDAALPQSAAQVQANIEALGFRIADVRWIANSHAHFDHAGGIAALQRASGARVAASPSGAAVLRAGTIGPDDPQYDPDAPVHSPRLAQVHEVRDGEALEAGPLRVTAISTPGHTPGGTSWTWRSCDGEDCRQVVYADSLTAITLGDFRYSGGAGRPDLGPSFAASIERIRQAPCDIVLSTHPGSTRMMERLAAGQGFVDAHGCRDLADRADAGLRDKLAREAAGRD